MSIYNDLGDGLITVAESALSEFANPIVILSHQNGTEPSKTYCVINVLSIEQQGHHSTSTQTTSDFKLNVRVVYEVMAQFSFIGSNSGDMAHSFTQKINNTPLVRESLTKNNLGFMRKSQVRRAPQKRDEEWVEYHNVDVSFNYIVNTTDATEWVESVIVDSKQTEVFTIPEVIETL